ncbi:MAG: S-layer homology domain-containing protein [Oscillospiraceae bacterium]|nr:S-layer homology domain-containing protein [Oscillospiraceae bacterium]
MKRISLSVKRLLALIIICCLFVTMVVPMAAFAEDITGHWAIDDINFLQEKGLVQGDSYGNINPDNNITRAEFVALINRTFEFNEVGETNFPDVNPGAWYYDDLAIAKNQGYIQGDDKGNANPGNPVTRAEAAVALARILDLEPQSYTNSFADSASFPEWSADGIFVVTRRSELFRGYPDNTFRASNSITRAEAIAIMARIRGGSGGARTIISFDTVITFTSIKTAPKMPTMITAHYSNGLSGRVSVTWDSIHISQYDSVGTFTVQGAVAGTSIQPSATVTVSPNAPVTFADLNFKAAVVDNLKQLPGYSHYTKDSDLYPENLVKVTSIYANNKEITSIGELSYFTNLKSLDCSCNNLYKLDISNNPALQYLSCSTNKLTTLDVSKNLALQYLSCSANKLATLDVSKNLALRSLYCEYSNLDTLNVGNNPALESLICEGNNLSILDVSNNPLLEYLYCWENNLYTLDVSNNPALQFLNCEKNNLSTLEVSNNLALESLSCGYNNLTALDVSDNLALEVLYCGWNNLTTLDISSNTLLEYLDCGDNRLTILDVSNNLALENLYCDSNVTILGAIR